ncbi:glutathione peroxidase-like isoform X1 [Biomphalaria glabrata]|nr:glutathione peroxidase-like isoform X1 [Biomphalaria glabrata]KAI8795059.1 glutathione peroxidase isoform X1 [Biomphalaria glabrata]
MQEPGANGTEIMNGIKYVRPGGGFVPNFQLFEKIEVNGVNEHILYIYLKSVCPPTATVFNQTRLFYTPIKASDVAWNFEAFLIGYDGKVVKRAYPRTDPLQLADDIDFEVARAKSADLDQTVNG